MKSGSYTRSLTVVAAVAAFAAANHWSRKGRAD